MKMDKINNSGSIDNKLLMCEVQTPLIIGQKIFALGWGIGGIDYICYPSDDKIMEGVVTTIDIQVSEAGIIIKGFMSDFKGSNYHFFPTNVNTFIFRSREDLIENFNELRLEYEQRHTKK
mgnify:FL=1